MALEGPGELLWMLWGNDELTVKLFIVLIVLNKNRVILGSYDLYNPDDCKNISIIFSMILAACAAAPSITDSTSELKR